MIRASGHAARATATSWKFRPACLLPHLSVLGSPCRSRHYVLRCFSVVAFTRTSVVISGGQRNPADLSGPQTFPSDFVINSPINGLVLLYLSVYLCVYLFTYLSIHLPIYLHIYMSMYLSITLSTYLSFSLSPSFSSVYTDRMS